MAAAKAKALCGKSNSLVIRISVNNLGLGLADGWLENNRANWIIRTQRIIELGRLARRGGGTLPRCPPE